MRKEKSRLRLFLAALFMAAAFMAVAMPSVTGTLTTVQAAEAKGWHGTGRKVYYVYANGSRAKEGWLKLGKQYAYIKSDGYRAVGQYRVGKKDYYFDAKTGLRQSGWKKVGKVYYYFNSKKFNRMTGWLLLNKRKYYLDPAKDGKPVTGFKTVAGAVYYFNKNGWMQTGWIKKGGKTYYADPTGKLVKGWYKVGSKKYYFNAKYQMTKQTTNMNAGLQKSTIRNFLRVALQPVGRCVYVWGGGWSVTDAGAGVDAVTIGVSPQWERFFNAQSSSYNYNTTRYQTRNGLDCSGYVGWALYNTFQTKNNQNGFVMGAEYMAKTFASRGWGSYKAAGTFTDFKAGDIMSLSSGHVYITVGQCSDGSVVLLHASPPGVQISGTYTRSGNKNSEAIKLANYYMKKYRASFHKKFPNHARGTSYLTSYSRMRWYLGANKMMTDPDGLTKMSAAKVLKSIFAAN